MLEHLHNKVGQLFSLLKKDIRFQEGFHACISCGTCSAICPAASFYNYDPRQIVTIVQSADEEKILELLKSEIIWYCGECMGCKTRCPRKNTPGLIIMALRSLSQKLGYFTESEKGRQQLFLKRTVGTWVLKYGYCMYPKDLTTSLFPEMGPVWDWEHTELEYVMERLGANYKQSGNGILRDIPEETLDELKHIFEVTGGQKSLDNIEKCSKEKAEAMDLQFDETNDNQYIEHIYTESNEVHLKG